MDPVRALLAKDSTSSECAVESWVGILGHGEVYHSRGSQDSCFLDVIYIIAPANKSAGCGVEKQRAAKAFGHSGVSLAE